MVKPKLKFKFSKDEFVKHIFHPPSKLLLTSERIPVSEKKEKKTMEDLKVFDDMRVYTSRCEPIKFK